MYARNFFAKLTVFRNFNIKVDVEAARRRADVHEELKVDKMGSSDAVNALSSLWWLFATLIEGSMESPVVSPANDGGNC